MSSTTTPTSIEEPESALVSNDEQLPCQRLTDFTSEDANRMWSIANDDVMGGRSLGEDTLIFEGEINTNGGGFASVRVPLSPDLLAAHDRVVLRVRPDGRSYTLDLDDSLSSRDRRVSHWAPIQVDSPGEWQTVSVGFDEFVPTLFGRRVDDVAFRNDLASGLRLILSDGIDGPFRLEVDWIEFCPG